MSWETIKKNMEEHNGKFRPEQSTAGKSVSKKERQNNKNFWNNTRDILVNTLKDTTIDQTKSFIKTGDFDRKDVWNRVQNIANNNLNRFNNTQKNIDVNTRNQMARNMEDFANRKRTAMQSVSNVIQENKKRKDEKNEQFRKQYPSTVDINQKQAYEIPKSEVKLADDELKSVWEQVKDKVQYIKKEGITGVKGAVAGMEDAYATKFANAIDKGQEKTEEEVAKELVWGLAKTLSPTLGIIEDNVNYSQRILNGENFGKTAMSEATKQTDRLAGLTPLLEATENVSSVLGEDKSENIKNALLQSTEWYNKEREELDKEREKQDEMTRFIGGAVNSVGNMAPSILASTITKDPSVGLTAMGIGAAGNSTREALNEGIELNKSIDIGNAKGWTETGTEKLFGGINYFGKGTFDDIFSKTVKDKVSSRVGKFLVKQGYDFSGEAIEENISNLAGYVIDNVVADKELPSINEMLKDVDETTKSTFLTTLILKGLGLPANLTNKKYIMQQEDVKNLPNTQKEKLSSLLDIVENSQNNNNNLQQNTTNNPINPLTQQITNQENKVDQNGGIEQANDILNNKKVPMQNYVYEESDNAKINNLRQDASKYFNNTEKAHNYINMLEKIIIDKNIDIRFDDNLMTSDGKVANGSYSNGVITINPNSTRAGEFIAIHELTHAIGTDAMRKIVDTYRKSNAEFDNEVKSLLKNYNATELTDEAMADVSAQIFGNQDFINNIAQNNPNVFQKICSEIKYLWHQFRGYKNQDQFVEDLYYKWTQAYNSNNELNSTSNYHISQNLSNDIDNILKNINERNPVRLRDYTPSILVNNGIKDLPMYENPSHIRKNILTDAEAQQLGLAINQRDHFHGLGKEIYMKAIDSLDDPRVIFKNNNNNEYLILTVIKDKKNNNVVVPIEVETNTNVNNVKIDINRVKTVYGYEEKNNIDLNDYIKYNIKENKFTKVYEQKKEKGTGFSTVANSTNSIPFTNVDVNTAKYSMQESENNSGSFNLSKNSEVRGSEKLNDATTLFEKNMDGLHTRNNISEFGHSPENTKYSQNNNIWKEYLENNFESTGTRTNLKDIRVPISKENLQKINLANNGQTVYNNTESEGGINGQSQFTNKQEISEQFEQSNGQSRIIQQNDKRRVQELFEKYQRGETNGASNSKELLRSHETRGITEQEVKKTLIDYANKYSKTELNENEIKLKNIINNLGGNVVFYEYGNNNIFEGLADKNTFYIDTLSESKTNNIFYHELTHFLRQNNNEIYMKEIQPIVEKIASDFNYQEAIFNYANSSGEYFDVRKLDGSLQLELAEEVVADQIASMYGDLEADYGIDSKIKEQLKTSMDKILNFNENQQEEANTTNQLKKVEKNTKTLDYEEDTGGKQRKHYKSVMESDEVGETGKKVAEDLLENDTYNPISNVDTLATANESINRNGIDNTYIAFRNKLNSNERITLQDIAIGERLIQIFSQNGDIEKVNELVQGVAMLGTELGQQVQAMSLIKKLSPEGQLMYLQKVIERTNIKENTDLKVSDDMSRRILETKSKEELENVMTDIAAELGEQLPVTMGDKVRSWRYLSMLGNPKTHIKNLGANVAMNVTQQLKNKVAGAMEDVVGMFNKGMERTKTLKFANKDQKSFAKKDAEFMKDKIDGGGKYDIKNVIQSNKRQFDNKTLNAIADFNSNMLELEDNIFLKKAYQQAMQNYMSANKLSSSDMENSSVLQKAREYASYQAQEATFHQFSELAKRLTEIENKGGIAGKALEAVIPFKKTPINIAKSGVEYSPIGLVKSLTYDIVQLNKKTKDYKAKLEKGVITEADYKTGTSKLVTKTIDNVAKGFTGTSLALIGYALKDMGILKSGNDDEDDEFREKLGEQEYAIRIGNNTYTLDWVSPSAIPMFMGATVHDLVHSQDEDNSNALNSLMTSSAKALEPMTEMSMLQGLTGAISSYEQGSSNMMFDLGSSAVSSYLGQFVPTALGQVAKTIDDKERDTSSTEKGVAKKVDQFAKQQLAKIPIASKLLPVRKDVWGNEKTRDSNPLVRAYEVGLAPYNRKKVVEDYTEKELLKVFEDTGEKSVLPGIPNKDITINKQKYRLTSEEYNKAKETFGKTSKSMLDSLVKTNEYKQLSHEQKASAIDNIYSYAKEKIKVDYAKGKKQEVETSSPYNILNELKNPTNQSEYLSYSAKIQGIEKDTEKKEILANGKYSEITKETIYKNTLGKEDDLYNNILAKDNININEYLNYKLQKFESDKEDDGTVKGKSIKGSRPKKLYDYVNNMNITKNQKLAIIGTQCKLDRNEQRELYNYINNIPGQTQKERLEMFSKYSSNFIVNKDNTINIK